MDRKIKIAFFLLLLFGFVAIGLVILYSGEIAVLSPKGMIGQKQCDLLLISTLLMLVVIIPVFILTFLIAWKYRASNKKASYTPDWDHNWFLELIWWGIPCLIMLVLGAITWKACHELDPFKPIDSNKAPIRIQVVALQWKWLFIYPDHQIASLNFIQFPEQTPINFEITADAPMNSFWIPHLGGQVYAMAGMKSKLHLIANEVGTFRGSSANLSGEGFSGMTFIAKSSSEEDFNRWVESVHESSQSLGNGEYDALLNPSSYVPPASFALEKEDLFESILMKYMRPLSKPN